MPLSVEIWRVSVVSRNTLMPLSGSVPVSYLGLDTGHCVSGFTWLSPARTLALFCPFNKSANWCVLVTITVDLYCGCWSISWRMPCLWHKTVRFINIRKILNLTSINLNRISLKWYWIIPDRRWILWHRRKQLISAKRTRCKKWNTASVRKL